MHRHVIACAALTLGCFVGTAAAQGQAPATTGSPKSSPSSTAPQSSSATKDASHADALAALQDARVTLSRLTEASMPQDAREALATVSTGFRGLYKAYTGEEPAPQKTAQQAAASMRQPDASWEQSYSTLSASIDRLVGNGVTGQGSAVGTSGTAGSARHSLALTTPVRQDFEVLRQQLQRFYTAAGGRHKTGPAVR